MTENRVITKKISSYSRGHYRRVPCSLVILLFPSRVWGVVDGGTFSAPEASGRCAWLLPAGKLMFFRERKARLCMVSFVLYFLWLMPSRDWLQVIGLSHKPKWPCWPGWPSRFQQLWMAWRAWTKLPTAFGGDVHMQCGICHAAM